MKEQKREPTVRLKEKRHPLISPGSNGNARRMSKLWRRPTEAAIAEAVPFALNKVSALPCLEIAGTNMNKVKQKTGLRPLEKCQVAQATANGKRLREALSAGARPCMHVACPEWGRHIAYRALHSRAESLYTVAGNTKSFVLARKAGESFGMNRDGVRDLKCFLDDVEKFLAWIRKNAGSYKRILGGVLVTHLNLLSGRWRRMRLHVNLWLLLKKGGDDAVWKKISASAAKCNLIVVDDNGRRSEFRWWEEIANYLFGQHLLHMRQYRGAERRQANAPEEPQMQARRLV